MKFALLGADAETLEFAQFLAAHPDHQLAFAYQIPGHLAGPLKNVVPRVAWREDWEALLHEPVADAVILASHGGLSAEGQAERGEQLRKLTQAGVPLLATCPACEAIIGFEVEMIRCDVHGILVPYHRDLLDPTLGELLDLVQHGESSSLGRLEQVVMERWVPGRDVTVLREQLARDTAIIRQLVGGIRRVSALGKAFMPAAVPFHLTANFDSDQDVLCTWTLSANPRPFLARLAVTGTRGQVAVSLLPDARQWKWEESPRGPASDPAVSEPIAEILRLFVHEVQKSSQAATPATPAASSPASHLADSSELSDSAIPSRDRPEETPIVSAIPGRGDDARPSAMIPLSWMDACRAQEAAETVERAVARGRTMELFNEEHSEAGTFKGIMAAGSCSLLMLTLLVLVVGSVIEGVRLPYARQRDRQAARVESPLETSDASEVDQAPPERALWIRLWPVYPLLVFLLLQALNLVFVPPAAVRSAGDSGSSPGNSPGSS